MIHLAKRIVGSRLFRGTIIAVIVFAGVLAGIKGVPARHFIQPGADVDFGSVSLGVLQQCRRPVLVVWPPAH